MRRAVGQVENMNFTDILYPLIYIRYSTFTLVLQLCNYVLEEPLKGTGQKMRRFVFTLASFSRWECIVHI